MTNLRMLKSARKNRTSTLGDLVAAAFDDAARVTADPGRATLIAALRVNRLLRQAHDRKDLAPRRKAA
jgi:hypothetical protein